MISLEDGIIQTEPVVIGSSGYLFEITDKGIKRYGLKSTDISKGVLVSKHFEPVFGCLYIAHLLKDCKVKEAIACYFMGPKEKDEYEKAPALDKCLNALLKQFSLMTDGFYDSYYNDCRIRHDGIEEEQDTVEECDGSEAGHDGIVECDANHENAVQNYGLLPYVMQVQDIFWHVLDLKEGCYHNSGNPKYEGRRGIPKIETTGERLYSELLDLIWRLDNGPDYQPPEEIEARKRMAENMKSIIPSVTDIGL